MKTIGVDIRVLGTGRTSGVEEYTEQVLAHMIVLDPSIHYKLFYAGRALLVRRPWMEASNVSVHETGMSNRLLWARTRLTGRPYLDELVGGADAFFFPHFLPGATSPTCRRVLTVHDLSFERFPELFSLSRRLWHGVSVSPRAQIHKADRIIAVSESTRRDVMSLYGIHQERVVTVHSGIVPVAARPREEKERFILMLGTIEPRKNIEAVVSAFERLPSSCDDVQLVIAGPRGWLWRGTIDQAERSPLKERIRFVDYVDDTERAALLSQASVLVYPSLMEGFGFPPLEAMASGTPAIIGANSSMLEVCGDAAVAVNPYAVGQLTDALHMILTDPAFSAMLVARGNRVIQGLSWHTSAERTMKAIFSTFDTVRIPVQ